MKDAVNNLANAVESAAKEIGKEGASGMGAIELLAMQTYQGLSEVAVALGRIADEMSKSHQERVSRDYW